MQQVSYSLEFDASRDIFFTGSGVLDLDSGIMMNDGMPVTNSVYAMALDYKKMIVILNIYLDDGTYVQQQCPIYRVKR